MARCAFTRPADLRRETRTESEPVREPAQRVQADMRDNLGVAGLDDHPERAVTVHVSGALS